MDLLEIRWQEAPTTISFLKTLYIFDKKDTCSDLGKNLILNQNTRNNFCDILANLPIRY